MIGQTNSQVGGGIRGEKANIMLLTNQSEHSDLLGAVITLKYAENETQYVWEGNGITMTIPPFVEYEISVSPIEGYATPEKVTGTAVVDNSRTLTFTYNTTVVTADIQNNQSAALDAKMTINGKELANGESAKFPTGSELSISFSDVEGFKTPDSKTTVAADAAMTVTGVYQAEKVKVSVSSASGQDMTGASVQINGTDYTYNGSMIEALVPFGVEYSIVPGAVESLVAPDIQTFTASQQIREVSLMYRTCTLVVNMLSNQPDDAVIANAKATVTYGDTSVEVGNGETINLPLGDVSITFHDVDGYRKPDAISFTHTGGEVEKTGTYETQVLTVNVVGSGATPSGYTVTITDTSSNIVLGTLTSDSGTFKIPYGTSYKVSASALTGYNAVTDQTGSANSPSNSITVTYVYNPHSGTTTPTNGIWIQDTDGYCHTADEWTGEYTPNGIAVVTSNCSFVMALSDAYSSTCQWGSYGTTVSGIVTTTNEATAKGDYAGESNTTTILNQLGNSSSTSDAPAAYYCRAFTFPNGKVGYMGAAGEWQAALDNKAAIATALSKVGGTAMSVYYWTSTQYSSLSSWYMYWNLEGLSDNLKSNTNSVRAFAAI